MNNERLESETLRAELPGPSFERPSVILLTPTSLRISNNCRTITHFSD
jgi:hypothetical protein